MFLLRLDALCPLICYESKRIKNRTYNVSRVKQISWLPEDEELDSSSTCIASSFSASSSEEFDFDDEFSSSSERFSPSSFVLSLTTSLFSSFTF